MVLNRKKRPARTSRRIEMINARNAFDNTLIAFCFGATVLMFALLNILS